MNILKDNDREVAKFWCLPGVLVLLFYAIFLLYYSFWNFWGLVDIEATVLAGLWYGGFLELHFWPHIVLWVFCIWVAILWYIYYRRFVICLYEITSLFKGGLFLPFRKRRSISPPFAKGGLRGISTPARFPAIFGEQHNGYRGRGIPSTLRPSTMPFALCPAYVSPARRASALHSSGLGPRSMRISITAGKPDA